MLNKNKLYSLIITACLMGYIWLFLNLNSPRVGQDEWTICPLKLTTSIPCPSCGTTRSVMSIYDGQFLKALFWNPFGFLVAICMIVCPIWVIIDWWHRNDSFFRAYHLFENRLKGSKYTYLLISIILINWCWNLIKDL